MECSANRLKKRRDKKPKLLWPDDTRHHNFLQVSASSPFPPLSPYKLSIIRGGFPGSQIQQTINSDGELVITPENTVDLSRIHVNGAVLSDYACSDNHSDQASSSTSAHLFIRYDKTVLNQLYKLRGSIAVASGYSLVAGSWKDFQ